MTKRDKILLYAVLMLAFIVLYVRFLLIPGIGSLQQARADLTEAQDAQITMQETILQAGVNAADKNTAWGELQTANARYYSILTSDELDTLVTGLELNHSMQPVSLSIGQPLTQSMTGYIAGTQAGQSPAPAGSAAAAVTADQVDTTAAGNALLQQCLTADLVPYYDLQLLGRGKQFSEPARRSGGQLSVHPAAELFHHHPQLCRSGRHLVQRQHLQCDAARRTL